MGVIWWGTRRACSPTFLDEGIQYAMSPHIFLLGFVFDDVLKLNVTFFAFRVKSFSC